MGAGRRQGENTVGPAVVALVMIAAGLGIAYTGYQFQQTALNENELVGPGLFWFGIVFFLIAAPLQGAARTFVRYVRAAPGLGTFFLYEAVHLVLWGFLLDAILSTIYGGRTFAESAGFFVYTNLFLPPGAFSDLLNVALNPSLVVTAPPVFGTVISFYSVAVATVIAILVVANVARTRELGRLCSTRRKARAYVVLPAVGIVFGASCCLSVAGLLAALQPSAAELPSIIWIYYATYFLLPVTAAVLLYLNLNSVDKLVASFKSSGAELA